MEIQVLGPLSADVNGVSIVPTAGKPRQILALLAFYPGRVMPVPTLMEEIWGTNMPQSAMTTMQTYILQLRRRLGTAMGPDAPGTAKEVLATRHGGYLLQVPPQSVDVHRYEQLVTAGQSAFDEGEDAQAAGLFRDALAMWQGPALVDVRVGPILEIEVMRLEESRLVIVERRIDSDLRLGRRHRAHRRAHRPGRPSSAARGPALAGHGGALPLRPRPPRWTSTAGCASG